MQTENKNRLWAGVVIAVVALLQNGYVTATIGANSINLVYLLLNYGVTIGALVMAYRLARR